MAWFDNHVTWCKKKNFLKFLSCMKFSATWFFIFFLYFPDDWHWFCCTTFIKVVGYINVIFFAGNPTGISILIQRRCFFLFFFVYEQFIDGFEVWSSKSPLFKKIQPLVVKKLFDQISLEPQWLHLGWVSLRCFSHTLCATDLFVKLVQHLIERFQCFTGVTDVKLRWPIFGLFYFDFFLMCLKTWNAIGMDRWTHIYAFHV